MPIHVAMQEPHARVCRPETKDRVTCWRNHPSIATHGNGGHIAGVAGPEFVRVFGLVLGTGDEDTFLAGNHLRGVAVDVHGVGAAVVVIDNDVVYMTLEEDERLCVRAVDDRVGSFFAGAHGGHEGGDFLLEIGDVVEPSSVLAVLFKKAEAEDNGLGRIRKKLLLIEGLDSEIVDYIERGNVHRTW